MELIQFTRCGCNLITASLWCITVLINLCYSATHWQLSDVMVGNMTFYDFYRQDLPQAALPVLFLYWRTGFGVFRPAGATRSPIKVKFGMEEQTVDPLLRAKFHLDRSRGGVYGAQNWKKWNFTNIVAPKERVPCTIFTEFTGFMRVLSLHKFTKCGCFISINDKIIKKIYLDLPRFQPNFLRPLAAKLWTGMKW